MTKNLLTTSELARFLGMARYQIYDWVRNEQIPYLRTVGRILFDREEIEKWLRRHRVTTKRQSQTNVRTDSNNRND